ncbi:hypothetical protein HUU05_06325 [candidate division KSB1 bacterium]|nr:hypothetical protein [candidate division KSB1 bacterium]
MPSTLSRLFTSTDLERIAAAVKAAEGQTAGEIVPFVVASSDDYEAALWRGGFALSALVWSAIVLAYLLTSVWLPFSLVQALLLLFLAQGLGMLLTMTLPSAKRFFAGAATLQRRVQQQALEAFLSEEVFRTREHTGILIFLSLFERRVVVLGDAGINAKVAPTEWEEVVQTIVAGMRTGQPAEGLLVAVHKCGVLLQKQGVLRREDDTDELANTLRMRGGKV